uniref:Cysteine sulfinic acid decarboxylase isoform X2 n=1 Tax=Geotrypetes seraphini TaxID=260995 RepID=A0A6P8R2Y2_GEOSA|nr:cysteine sulfinic acid decarboxylase isoform X2 [Geotrypetes seraphini]
MMGDKHSLYHSVQDTTENEQFLEQVFRIILEEVVRKGTDAREKICNWKDPEELQSLLDLELRTSGESADKLLEYCQDVIRYSVKTDHPRFSNQLFSGLDQHALAGRMITEALNTSMATYETAPVFVLMEEVLLKKLRELIGWQTGDGIFCPGGSISNMYAMNLARYRTYPDCKQKGLWALPKLVAFTSLECHYSIQKAAAFLGIGTDNIVLVQVDDQGKMIPEELEREICEAKSQDRVPFLATWGGSALLSRQHRHLLNGIERADSVSWNAHKMLATGLQCAAFLLKDKSDLLKQCYCANASYLFQIDKFYDISYDTGDKSIQCGRKVDCLKFWLMWKANGTEGLEKRVDRAFSLTKYLVEEIKKREGFHLVMEPEFVNICFWYIPPCLRGKEECDDYWERLGKVAPVIKERMVKKGSMMVGYQPHGSKVNFFRQIVVNPSASEDDMNFFLDEIERLGHDL